MEKIKLLIVDDSALIRNLMKQNLSKGEFFGSIETASNGLEGYEMAVSLEPDVILMDVEMPVMGGIESLTKIRAKDKKVKIIMVSAVTTRGAEITLDALSKGADDYIPKPSSNAGKDSSDFFDSIIRKIKALKGMYDDDAHHLNAMPQKANLLSEDDISVDSMLKKNLPQIGDLRHFDTIAIASSTGGPEVLGKIFNGLSGININKPIFITQHMPENFTKILAERLSKSSGKLVKEGEDGEKINNNTIYVAPGNYHMLITRDVEKNCVIKTNQNPPIAFCRPSADPMFGSITAVYNKVLAIVLTGMGHDGVDGGKIVVDNGGFVVAQNKESCAVWGMPRMVTMAGLVSEAMSIEEIIDLIRKVYS